MRKDMELWSEFLGVWSPDRVRGMSLEEYTNLNRDDAFSYWLEQRTKSLGDIRGGSAFKFGIFRQAKKETKAPKGAIMARDEYAWMRKYGGTPEAAYAEVRSRLTHVLDAVRSGDLQAVERVDFSPTVKWKVAFLYQARDDPKLLAIYSETLLRACHGEVFPDAEERPLRQQHAALIERYSGLGDILDISRKIWTDHRASDDRPKASHPRNRILYGPPGTGKTYSTVNHALAIIDGVKPTPEVAEPDRQRFRRLGFEHAADSAPARGRIAMVTFHQNYAYEDFVEGIRPRLDSANNTVNGASSGGELGYELRPGIFREICESAMAADEERFVLIIDEINRGNIPKIFGELITLIEDSRRLGATDETRVTLPYSGDDFGVPDNLYIIGTMNTADRSIQQLDTALRRRFTFVEMMPNPEHPLVSENVAGVNCRRMLRAMNERIALLLDREHQIGHTYLLNVESIEDLGDRFRNRIFPLLQEYFYDDWRRIGAVLGGNAFVQEANAGDGRSKTLIEEFDLVDQGRVIHERLPDDDPAWNTAEEYQRIYEPKSG